MGLDRPELTARQLDPLFVERNTPPRYVPAKRLAPFTAIALTSVVVKPELTAVHVAPLSVERETPPKPFKPARRLLPLVAMHCTDPPLGPFVCCQEIDGLRSIVVNRTTGE